MKSYTILGTAACTLFALQADEAPQPKPLLDPEPREEIEIEETGTPWSFEAEADFSVVSSSTTRRGNVNIGSVSGISNHVRLVGSKEIADTNFLRLGVDWNRSSFGIPSGTALPNTLQSTSLVIGGDFFVGDNWIIRVEAEPGIYSDFSDVSTDDFNVPAIIGVSYLVNKDLQWVFGARIDPWASIPVIPGAGVRWAFADDWVLNFILPSPKLEYQVTDGLKAYIGAEFKGGTFRVREAQGTPIGRPRLDNAIVEYREIRTGGGLIYDVNPALSLEFEGGYMIERRFDYHRVNLQLESEGAGYGEIGIKAKF